MSFTEIKRRVLIAFTMSLITGSMTVTVSILYNFGYTENFWHLWFHSVRVVYPTIMCSILFIAPHVHRFIDRQFQQKEKTA